MKKQSRFVWLGEGTKLFFLSLGLALAAWTLHYIISSETKEKELVETEIKIKVDKEKTASGQYVRKWESFRLLEDTTVFEALIDSNLYKKGWDTLPQVEFWRKLMYIGPDRSIINLAETREIFGEISTRKWNNKSRRRKKKYRDSVMTANGVDLKKELYITSGRSHFYHFQEVLPALQQALPVFRKKGIDPWYAQAILYIESPNRLQKSTAGAYGAFQLMRGVARQNGLKVNRRVDERSDIVKSAGAAARFLKKTCIPLTENMLEENGIFLPEESLEFRLMVLHVYHAGARNVKGALKSIKSYSSGQDLIRQLWRTKYKNFGNASQNYSQLVIATQLELQKRVGAWKAATRYSISVDTLRTNEY